MPKSSDPDVPEIARRNLAVARTQINHIVGYSGILGEDALDADRGDMAKLYAAIADSAVELREPLLARLRGAEAEAGREAEALDREIYGILYDLIARVQSAKGEASAGGLKGLAAETERLLDQANAVLELMAALSDSAKGAAEEEAVPLAQRKDVEDEGLEPASRPGRILVVDDNVFNREILSRHLERQGHAVRVASDGVTALEALRAESFDVAIIDVMMPGMNGYQLLERIKADASLRGVRPIVISSLEDTQTIARCIRLGAEDYLPREFEPVILKARIESCLEKKRMKEEQELYVAALLSAREKLEQELHGGADYVRSLLPNRVSSPALEIDWEFIPSASLGGDVFGYHFLDGGEGVAGTGRLALYLIDVSGHGIEAALFSVTLMNMLKTQVLPGADFADPGSVLGALNASFRMEEQNYLFFTAWYGVWEPASRELRYSSAGSPPAILVRPDGSASSLMGSGTIVGVDPEAGYESRRADVPEGSKLYVFSDGIYEFRANDGTIFGIDRFQRLLAGAAGGRRSGPALRRILDYARAECSTESFPDDISLLEFRLG
jgi:sigma-B regulation protein RsbU (phosphoserine phosphatase)